MIYELYFKCTSAKSGKSYASSTFHTNWDNALADMSKMAWDISKRLPVSDVPRSWGYFVDCGKWGSLDFEKGTGELTLRNGDNYIWKVKKFKDDTAYYNGEETKDE